MGYLINETIYPGWIKKWELTHIFNQEDNHKSMSPFPWCLILDIFNLLLTWNNIELFTLTLSEIFVVFTKSLEILKIIFDYFYILQIIPQSLTFGYYIGFSTVNTQYT